MKQTLIFCFLLTLKLSVFAQNTNFRAQGNYYTAKSHFQNKNYTETLDYVNKSKTGLEGTNRELQYLHILAAYNLYKYEEAAKELQVFFDIEEKKIEPIYFDKSVERLTNDETKALVMLIDPILESAEKKKNNPCSTCLGSGIMKKIITCENCSGNGYIKTVCQGKSAPNNLGGVSVCNNGKWSCSCYKCGKYNNEKCVDGYHLCESGDVFSGFRRWRETCKVCYGSGKLNCKHCNGVGYFKNDCTKCNNTGKVESTIEKVQCNRCYGRGF